MLSWHLHGLHLHLLHIIFPLYSIRFFYYTIKLSNMQPSYVFFHLPTLDRQDV